MASSLKNTKPINVQVADLSDGDLDIIVQLRKKVKEPEEREAYVKGLLHIAMIDNDYAEDERSLVEGTACALGINESRYNEIKEEIATTNETDSFTSVGGRRFREQLFEEMGALTYIKGYQLSTEDDELKQIAETMEIADEKSERILTDLYMQAQGFAPRKSTAAKIALGAGGIVAGAAICGLTAGVAAPAIGAILGSSMGLSGAAASSAGLALLGGGSLAAGGGGVAAGTAAVIATGSVVGGGASALAVSVKDNISGAYDQKKLKAIIKKQQKDDMTKQEITENLIKAIDIQKKRLEELERVSASKRDLASVKLQIANMEAQKAELELEGGE